MYPLVWLDCFRTPSISLHLINRHEDVKRIISLAIAETVIGSILITHIRYMAKDKKFWTLCNQFKFLIFQSMIWILLNTPANLIWNQKYIEIHPCIVHINKNKLFQQSRFIDFFIIPSRIQTHYTNKVMHLCNHQM